ncbi:protein strawberry notch homolog 1 [Scaptodrosophila lebanonensis]|uniref:Protein strawberry notch homolog 1 n=1 Tax=Drosophila lebanonensis TaxID=7225 RepID=A0A6J2TS60_DROLE|nr:protein strawberry notch homolog 1 [Scaptodrosophila lebanonensis]
MPKEKYSNTWMAGDTGNQPNNSGGQGRKKVRTHIKNIEDFQTQREDVKKENDKSKTNFFHRNKNNRNKKGNFLKTMQNAKGKAVNAKPEPTVANGKAGASVVQGTTVTNEGKGVAKKANADTTRLVTTKAATEPTAANGTSVGKGTCTTTGTTVTTEAGKSNSESNQTGQQKAGVINKWFPGTTHDSAAAATLNKTRGRKPKTKMEIEAAEKKETVNEIPVPQTESDVELSAAGRKKRGRKPKQKIQLNANPECEIEVEFVNNADVKQKEPAIQKPIQNVLPINDSFEAYLQEVELKRQLQKDRSKAQKSQERTTPFKNSFEAILQEVEKKWPPKKPPAPTATPTPTPTPVPLSTAAQKPIPSHCRQPVNNVMPKPSNASVALPNQQREVLCKPNLDVEKVPAAAQGTGNNVYNIFNQNYNAVNFTQIDQMNPQFTYNFNKMQPYNVDGINNAAYPRRTYTKVPGVTGEEIPLSYVTEPNGQITNVTMFPPIQNTLPAPGIDGSPGFNFSSHISSNIKNPLIINTANLTAEQINQIMKMGSPCFTINHAGQTVPLQCISEGTAAQAGQQRFSGPVQEPAVEDEEVDYEEIGVADTYAEYWPSKLKVGVAHPDAVVETASLSSVEPPNIFIKLALPTKVQVSGCLSALQLEAVLYACQAHERFLPNKVRAGFLLGDGAGVGKGRTIAAIIYENYLWGRTRALWISVSSDLKFDAERDFQDIGAHAIQVVTLNKFKYSRISSAENEYFKQGVIFCTYTALIGESLTAKARYKTRLKQLVNWMGSDFDGVIVFDECHKAKNLSLVNVGKSTKTGSTVLELQNMLPKARVVYASATGASEPRNMAYMVRLGLWGQGTAYPEFFDFVTAVEKRGIGAMEIIAMDMKLRGAYIARQLSFKDVSFRIEEVPMSREFRKLYNHAAELWAEINRKFQKACRFMCIENRIQKIITCQFWCAHQRFFKNLCIASKVTHVVKMTRHALRMGKAVVIGLQSTGESRTLEHLDRNQGELRGFVSTSKMIVQTFVEKHFPAPKRENFHKLISTGRFEPESRNRPPASKRPRMNPDWFDDDDMDAEADESDIELFDSAYNMDDEDEEDVPKVGKKRRGRPPKADKVEKVTVQDRILMHLHQNLHSKNQAEPSYTSENTKHPKANITERDVDRCISMREHLLERIERLGRKLPANTLDKLIFDLGGTKVVAEMTGRRGRIIKTESNTYEYVQRCEIDTCMDLVNYREKGRFMDGDKHVAIISEAASSGISLQSDKRVSNQRRRLHITLELPWSADRAIQQFGRTHRSNQVNSPEYVFLITDLAGERRFAATVAKRLESLGALTHGDRRATDARDLSQFNIDNNIGRNALDCVMQEITGEKELDRAHVPNFYKGNFCWDCSTAMAGVGMIGMRNENNSTNFVIEKDSNNVSKFLNRILGCRVEVQNALFKFFMNKMFTLIMQMKRAGRFDLGILDLDAHGASVTSVKLLRFIRQHATGTAATELHTVKVERGLAFETALQKLRKEKRYEYEGFYVLKVPRNNKNCAILCLSARPDVPGETSTKKIQLQIYRANTGPQVRTEFMSSITNRYLQVVPETAEHFWRRQYEVCVNFCSHYYWSGVCPFSKGCEVGLRVRTYHVLSGLMLPIWDRIEQVIEMRGHKIQMIRFKTDVNKKIVGTVVPNAVYNYLVVDLSNDSTVEEVNFS